MAAQKLHLTPDHNATMIKIKVLKTHLQSLKRQHSWLLTAYFRLKQEEIKRLAEKTQNELLDVGSRLKTLQEEFPSAFKEA